MLERARRQDGVWPFAKRGREQFRALVADGVAREAECHKSRRRGRRRDEEVCDGGGAAASDRIARERECAELRMRRESLGYFLGAFVGAFRSVEAEVAERCERARAWTERGGEGADAGVADGRVLPRGGMEG